MWNIFQCKSARELGAENKSSHTMFHHIFEQLFSGSTMRGRQLGSNTGRSELWGTERHHMRPAQAGTKWTQNWHRDILRQFILILIYFRYTKHARRSNSNSVIDIRDWTLTDCVGINLNYSGSIFVFWCHLLSPEWLLLTDQCQSAAGVCHGPGPQRPGLRSLMQL